jgi:hypothetical protein
MLRPEVVKDAELYFVREVQRTCFNEYAIIREGKPLPSKSSLQKLMPKWTVSYAKFLPYEFRFPVILLRGSWVTKLIIGKHVLGTNHTLADLSNKYCIEAPREKIRAWEKECNECKRRNAKAVNQVMAPLLLIRLQPPIKSLFLGIS